MTTQTVSPKGIPMYRVLGHTISDEGAHDVVSCCVPPDPFPVSLGQTDTTFIREAWNTAEGLERYRKAIIHES